MWNSGSIVDSLELVLNENMYNHVLSRFDDSTSLRGTQKIFSSFYYVDLLEILTAEVKRGLANLLSAPIREATFNHPNFVNQ